VCVRPCVYVCVGGRACMSAGVLCACNIGYPVCHAQAPYCLLFLWLHYVFRHDLINGTIFGKRSLNIKCLF
jgi:hypothetical protein